MCKSENKYKKVIATRWAGFVYLFKLCAKNLDFYS